MDPISILGISLATIIAGEAILAKVYIVLRTKDRPPQPEFASLPVSDTT
jgi:hypothetical protein